MLISGGTPNNYNPTGYASNQATYATIFAVLGGALFGFWGSKWVRNHNYAAEFTGFVGDDGASLNTYSIKGARARLSVFEGSAVISSTAATPLISSPRLYLGFAADAPLVSFSDHVYLGGHSFVGGGTVGSPAAVWGIGPTIQIDRIAIVVQYYMYWNSNSPGVLGINAMSWENDVGVSFSI